MNRLSEKEKQKWSNEIPVTESPALVQEILSYWESKKGDHSFPLKSDILPWELIKHIGQVCILEVMQNPEDYIYRLDGTTVTAATIENLTGDSILSAKPEDFAVSAFMDMSECYTRQEPILWQISMRHEKRQYDYLRLILPLSDTGDGIKYLMTYSHRLGLSSGELPRSFGNDVPSRW